MQTTREARRAMKQERRAERQQTRAASRARRRALASSRPTPPWLRQLGLMAAQAVYNAQGLQNSDGHERRAEAIENLSDELDAILTWGWLGPLGPVAEILDGPLCDLIARVAVDSAYRAMRAAELRAAEPRPS